MIVSMLLLSRASIPLQACKCCLLAILDQLKSMVLGLADLKLSVSMLVERRLRSAGHSLYHSGHL